VNRLQNVEPGQTMNPDPINPQAWNDLLALGGDDADTMVDELIGMYIEDATALIVAIRRDHQAGQPQALARSAHALRSPSATLGALPLAELCRLVEERCSREGLPPDTWIEELVAEAERVFIDLGSRRRGA
jgi:HPt (histidine-containing phosphotransfer) domain-containing protein